MKGKRTFRGFSFFSNRSESQERGVWFWSGLGGAFPEPSTPVAISMEIYMWIMGTQDQNPSLRMKSGARYEDLKNSADAKPCLTLVWIYTSKEAV